MLRTRGTRPGSESSLFVADCEGTGELSTDSGRKVVRTWRVRSGFRCGGLTCISSNDLAEITSHRRRSRIVLSQYLIKMNGKPKGPQAARLRQRKLELLRRFQIPGDLLPVGGHIEVRRLLVVMQFQGIIPGVPLTSRRLAFKVHSAKIWGDGLELNPRHHQRPSATGVADGQAFSLTLGTQRTSQFFLRQLKRSAV